MSYNSKPNAWPRPPSWPSVKEGRQDSDQYKDSHNFIEMVMPSKQVVNSRCLAARHLGKLRLPLTTEELRECPGVSNKTPQRDARDVPSHGLGDLGFTLMETGALARSAILDYVPGHVATFDPALGVDSVDDMKNLHFAELINGLHVDVVDAALTSDVTMIIGTLVFARHMFPDQEGARYYAYPDYDAEVEEEEEEEKLTYIQKLTNALVRKLAERYLGGETATTDGAGAETEV